MHNLAIKRTTLFQPISTCCTVSTNVMLTLPEEKTKTNAAPAAVKAQVNKVPTRA